MTEQAVASPSEAPTEHDLVNAFMTETMASMSDWERAQLPLFAGGEVGQCVAKALKDIRQDDHAPARLRVHDLVVGLYRVSPETRFVYDPFNNGAIAIGQEDELVALQDSEIIKTQQPDGSFRASIKNYSSVVPLTGPRKGEKIPPQVYADMTSFRQ